MSATSSVCSLFTRWKAGGVPTYIKGQVEGMFEATLLALYPNRVSGILLNL